MTERSPAKPRSKKRRRLKRAAIAGAIVLAALFATPFVFTTPLVRYFIAHSALRAIPLSFESARLSPMGALTVRGVSIQDTGESAGKPLISARTLRLEFSWPGLFSSHLRTISAQQVEATLRPGADTACTLLRLFTAPPPPSMARAAASSVPAPAAGSSGGLQFDQLVLDGDVRLDGYDALTAAMHIPSNARLPVQLAVRSDRSAEGGHGFSLLLGDVSAPAAPSISSRFHLAGAADQSRLEIETLRGANLLPHAPPLLLDHFNLAWGTGTSTGPPPRGQAAPGQQVRFAFDGIGYGDLHVLHGMADLTISDEEIALLNLDARLEEGELAAAAALDRASGLLSRGHIYLTNIAASKAMAVLPAALRESFPGSVDARLTARAFLTESAPDLIAAHVELACPDNFRFAPRSGAAGGWRALPAMELANSVLSGDVSWNYRPDSIPEWTRGRLSIDRAFLPADQAAGIRAPVEISNLKSDFSFAGGVARLDDFYANLPANGRLTAAGAYNTATRAFEKTAINFNGIDGSLLTPWLPKGWSLDGQVDTGVLLTHDARGVGLTASLSLAAQSVLATPHGQVIIVGSSPPPSLALRGTLIDAPRLRAVSAEQTWLIENAELSGLARIQASGELIAFLEHLGAQGANPSLAALLDSLESGASLALDKVAYTGKLSLPGTASAPATGPLAASFPLLDGTLAINGLDLAPVASPASTAATGPATAAAPFADAERTSIIQNLTVRADIMAPLSSSAPLASYHLSNGELLAERLSLGALSSSAAAQSPLSGVSAHFTFDGAKAGIKDISLSFAEGTVSGDAALSTVNGLDALHLQFRSISQQLITRNLYPEIFTAEGPISGTLTMGRAANQQLAGSIDMATEGPGRIRLSRETASKLFAPAAQAAAQANSNVVFPPNFDQIIVGQLADYPYVEGHITLRDDPQGMLINLTYKRAPLQAGEPGFSVPVTVQGLTVQANLPFNITGATLPVNKSITDLLKMVTGFDLQRPAATQPRWAAPQTPGRP